MKLTSIRLAALSAIVAAVSGISASASGAQPDANPIPRLASQDGRYALFVDGAPFFSLGAQSHNSSAWPAMLPKVWPAMEYLHANTLETPVYWEQFEPEPGKFDTSVVDTLLKEAREHHVRLTLLWFGTWKNGRSHYIPLWAKSQPEKFPGIIGKNGRRINSPSPHAPAALAADMHAFSALMRHLKEADPQRTVILIQVENEPGAAGGGARDYSPEAQKFFNAAVPAELLKALGGKSPAGGDLPAGGTWPEVFGADADEYFHAWSVGRYIGQVAAAGKAEYALPMYVNAALRDPFTPGPAGTYESGGPTDNVLGLWKAAAPAIDILAPDIYMNDEARYVKVLERYSRPDNALLVPETGLGNGRMCFAALGHGAIGWAPFGLDYTAYANEPLGSPRVTEQSLAQLRLTYQMLEPIMREVARANFEGKLQAVYEERGQPTKSMDFGEWRANVTFGAASRRGGTAAAAGNPTPVGRALVAKIAPNRFWVTGVFCRVDFRAASGGQREFLRVEEFATRDGQKAADNIFSHNHDAVTNSGGVIIPQGPRFVRIWNGDETDNGLNFSSAPQPLQVLLGTF